MNSLQGTGKLARLVLRRDRIRMPLWVLFFSLFPVALANSIKTLYPTVADQHNYFANSASNAAYMAIFGPAYGWQTGALVAQRMTDVKVIIALISLLTVIRHTRAEEEAGRRELLAAIPIGRQAPLTAALLVTVIADLVLGLIFAGGLGGLKVDGTGTLALALALSMAGIQFRLGSFTPALHVRQLVDGSITLPEATGGSFWLNGSVWPVPDYDDADVFVNRLVRQGLLVRDPVVEDALGGRPGDLSSRSVQRRVLRATGLTQNAIRQIERAKQAVELLDRGVPIIDAVGRAGYADQAHMTRALKRFVGQTPGQIVRQ